MKRFFQITALLTGLMLMSATAWSATYDDHVSQAPNGQGDYLFYPVYFAFEGFQTKLQVTNTAPNVSAIAKVVVRSPMYSQETLDFFIFLTPTDVWEGYLQWENGRPIVYSEDDSILVDDAPTFASPGNPVRQPLIDICGDPNILGYVEVFLVYVFPENYQRGGSTINLTTPPVNKNNMFRAYFGSGTLINPIPEAGQTPREALINTNILAGNLQIQSPLLNWTSALNAVTLKDYLFGPDLESLLSSTNMGFNSNNNRLEVEAALSKWDIGMPYINNAEGNTFHFFNFPTKQTLLDPECRILGWRGEYAGFVGHNYNQTTERYESVRVKYDATIYDQAEQVRTDASPIFSPVPIEISNFLWEVDFVSPSAFEKGWVRYGLPLGPTRGFNLGQQPLGYFGAPVIPVVMNFGAGGFSTMYGFYKDGIVQGIDGEEVTGLVGYQYTRSTPGT